MRSFGIGVGALAVVVLGACFVACGSSSSKQGELGGSAPDGSAPASEASAGDDADDEAAVDVSAYPAFTPDMPQILNGKGGVLDKGKVVTITWASDPNAATFQAFDDAIGTSAYWSTSTGGYGVGPITGGDANHVVIETASPSPWDDNDIDTWVAQMANSPATSGWPANDSETLYVVYIPPTVQVTDSGTDACQSFDGYHTQLPASGSAPPVAYALILEGCYVGDQLPLMQDATETASHEIVEGATDPDAADGWTGFDTGDLSWELWNEWQDEVADACESFDEGYYLGTGDLPYWLSRVWSNASGLAGHDPCVPAPAGAYNNVTPLGLESVSVKATDVFGNVSPFKTKGWHIAPGATATVQVGFYSDAPKGEWSVQATTGDCCGMLASKNVTVSPNTFSGKNGDTVTLNVKVSAAPSDGTTVELLTFSSSAGTHVDHYMPVVIGVY